MARAVNNGWDFVKVGGTYQYKEDMFFNNWMYAIVNNSDDKNYSFKLKVLKSTIKIDEEFEVMHTKDDGVYNGMPQFYEGEEYVCDYKYVNENA